MLFGCSVNMSCQIKQFNDFPKEILEQMDKMGMDESCTLTDLEGEYLNSRLAINTDIFNFCGKKVAFFNGKLGDKKSNKQIFFADEKRRNKDGNFPNPIVFYILSDYPKIKTNGYDAVIVFWYMKVPNIKSISKNL
jgi:hypothetical protein